MTELTLTENEKSWIDDMGEPIFNQVGQAFISLRHDQEEPQVIRKIVLYCQRFNVAVEEMTGWADACVMFRVKSVARKCAECEGVPLDNDYLCERCRHGKF